MSNPYGLSDERWQDAQVQWERYRDTVATFSDMLVAACKADQPQKGLEVTQHLLALSDPQLITLVLNRLAFRAMEREAEDELPWAKAFEDQVEASIEQDDPDAMARILVDGQLRALREDMADPRMAVDTKYVVWAMRNVPEPTMRLMTAEALRRCLSG